MKNEQKNGLSVLLKYKAELIKWGIVAIILIIALVILYAKGYSNASKKYEEVVAELESEVDHLSDPIAVYEEASTEVMLNLIKAEIKGIGELSTVEYMYTDAGKFEDPIELLGVNIPFSKKSFIAKWDGNIKAGIQIDKVIVEINDAQKEIIIHMPKAEILSHEIEEDSIETLDEKNGLFNPLKVEDVRKFDAESKQAMEKRAIENGILDKALENAEAIIEKLVNNDVVQEQGYAIKFEVIE